MPDSALSQALREAYAAAPTDEVILHTLEFNHPAFTVPIRVVRDHADLVATLEAGAPINPGQPVTFTAYAFDFDLPQVDGPAPEIQITIDNVSREITRNIEAAAISGQALTVIYRPFLSTDLTAPQMNPPLHLTVTSIEADQYTVTARAQFRDVGNKRFPGEDYTGDRFPGLVA